MRSTARNIGVLALLVASGLLGACSSGRPATPGMIGGRFIAALGDADMSSSAFATNELGERDPNATDTLASAVGDTSECAEVSAAAVESALDAPAGEPAAGYAALPLSA